MSEGDDRGGRGSTDRLRAEAEAILTRRAAGAPGGQLSDELLHELRVHQIELEMQNEALRQAQNALEESRDQFVALYEFAPVGYLSIGRTGLIERVNLTATRLFGITRKAALRRRFSRLVGPADRDRWERMFVELIHRPGAARTAELTLLRAGAPFQARINCVVVKEGDRGASARLAISDVSVEAEQARSLRDAREFVERVMESVGSAIVVLDRAGRVVRVNAAATAISGFAEQELLGRPLPARVDPELRGRLAAQFRGAVNEGRSAWGLEVAFTTQAGECRIVLANIVPLHTAAGISGVIVSAQEITERKRLEEEIKRLADYDALTDLPNRRPFYDIIAKAIGRARRQRTRVAILFLDLDRFKSINDTLGHEAGDTLLVEAANRLRACIRSSDTAARVGGDEFNILLTDITRGESAAEAARQILGAFTPPFLLAGQELSVTTSIGISVYPEDGTDAEALIARADAAMYEAKRAGGGSYRFFDRQMNTRASERAALENDLRSAIARQQFQILYQPRMRLSTGEIVGVEALLRWHHPLRGTLEPAAFMGVAEESRLMIPIGNWVLRTACCQGQAWRAAGLWGLTVAVNLSACQFRQSDLVNSVDAALSESGLAPGALALEIAESTVMEEFDASAARLAELARHGLQLCLDNFGRGRTALQWLGRMSFHSVKIDGSLIESVESEPGIVPLVNSLVALSHNLHMQVVGQGVETGAQLALLRSNACDDVQGVFIRPPLPADQLGRLLLH